jgi:SAM-dependent methyltransferase
VPNLLHSSLICGVEYIYYPITAYRKLILKEVLSRVAGGDVLDLGCGQAGVYWSLAYATQSRSICYFDYLDENLAAINRQLSQLSPAFIEENFDETFQFLLENNLLPANCDTKELAENILHKVDLVKEYDFRLLSTSRKFDTIISIEAIECVASTDELNSTLAVCRDLLKSGGQLLGIVAKYDQFTARTQELIDTHFGGALNPDASALSAAFAHAGFEINQLKTVSTPELHNYSEAIIYDVRKS